MAAQVIEHFDVVIIGAGISGIDAGHHLQALCPKKTYVILEQRQRVGGTWDLFRYPGIRSDSDMLTMGFSFRPWTRPKTISPGEDIRTYVEETAREEGIDRHIRFGHSVQRATWNSSDAAWTIEATHDGEPVKLTCNFLFCCAGYYRYSSGYSPELPGEASFEGRLVHPQHWPEDLDYVGKKVVVIGSGATAVTLIPAMAKTAAHVTMLQRSPTYVVSAPGEDKMAVALRKILPDMWVYRICRWRNMGFMLYMWQLSRRAPQFMKKGILKKVREHLGPDYDVDTHFTPRYNPWDQRMCLVPDADMFEAIKSGRASVETDQIEQITAHGIRLKSGKQLDADVIVKATGLVMQAFGGIELVVDGEPVDISKRLAYKGVMISGVPNLASVFGYINASWTIKADMICDYVCRLLNAMDRRGARQVVPDPGNETAAATFVVGFTAGYMERSLAAWPKQGHRPPWRVNQNILRDRIALKWSKVEDGYLKFSTPAARSEAARELATSAR